MQNDTTTILTAPAANPHKRIPARIVRDLCGGVADMTLWRWVNDPDLNFPKPLYIAKRRYWKEAEILAWLDARDGKSEK